MGINKLLTLQPDVFDNSLLLYGSTPDLSLEEELNP
jgi:hypothetical protein